jgi:hypothetical protein
MEGLVVLIIFGGVAFIIAHFLGRKRQIGFGWSFFFCLFLTPIFGFLITMLSKKYYDPNPEPSIAKKVWGWLLIVSGSSSTIGQILKIANGLGDSTSINSISIAIGLVGLGFYLLELSKGKNFNSDAITKTDE